MKAIVNTHHHYDHSDGNPFSTKVSGFANYCKDSPLVTYTPSDNETLELGEDLTITVHLCHTQDSICYFVQDKKTNEKAVFTGDTSL